MAAALVGQNLHHFIQHRPFILHHIERQHRAKLFHGVGPGRACLFLPGHQHLRPLRHRKPGHFRKPGRRLAHHLRVQGPVGPEQQLPQPPGFDFRHEVEAQLRPFPADRLLQVFFHNDALLRGADGSVVEGLGLPDALQRPADVRAAVDIGRAVAGTHADGRLPGGIGRADHGRASRGQNQLYLGRRHQLPAAVQGGNAQAADGPLRRPRPFCGLRHNLRRLPGTADGLGMGRKDDGIARLQGNQRLIADRGGGIRTGYDGGDDPHRNTHLPQLLPRHFPQNSHCFHIPYRRGHGFRGKAVFRGFIFGIAEACFTDRHLRQGRRLLGKGLGHRFHDLVQLSLGEVRQLLLGRLRLFRQDPGLLPGR